MRTFFCGNFAVNRNNFWGGTFSTSHQQWYEQIQWKSFNYSFGNVYTYFEYRMSFDVNGNEFLRSESFRRSLKYTLFLWIWTKSFVHHNFDRRHCAHNVIPHISLFPAKLDQSKIKISFFARIAKCQINQNVKCSVGWKLKVKNKLNFVLLLVSSSFICCRNTYHIHRKYRRHTNELIEPAVNSNRHHLMASSSQLSIEVSELHASNNGRLEITCLATIPAHVGVGEQFADYKTYSVKSKWRETFVSAFFFFFFVGAMVMVGSLDGYGFSLDTILWFCYSVSASITNKKKKKPEYIEHAVAKAMERCCHKFQLDHKISRCFFVVVVVIFMNVNFVKGFCM